MCPQVSSQSSPVLSNKRGTLGAIPSPLGRYLNDAQLIALRSLESFGWHLAFIRRPLFQASVVVVASADRHRLAVLEDDGSVNTSSSIALRL